MKRAIFVAFFAAVLIFGDAEAADSVEAIIELGYHYTFEIDSSYVPWSWTLTDTEKYYEVTDISDNASTVIIQAIRNLRDSYHDFYIFSNGTLTAVFDSVHDVTTNHAGDKLIVAKDPITCCFDYPSSVDCYDVYGTKLWGPVLYSEKPVWSPDDSFVGLYSGESFLNSMPAYFWDLINISDWLDPQFVETQFGAKIFSSNGIEQDLNNINWGNVPYFDLGCFRNKLGGYLSYIFRHEEGSRGLYGFESPIDDTLKIYDTRDGEFNLVNQIIPFVIPDSYEVASVTCPTINWASFNHNIYGARSFQPLPSVL